MTRAGNGIRAAIVAVILAAAFTGKAPAQVPDEFKNLQVLPKGIVKADLLREMKGFAIDLGVRCVHCHVGEDNPRLEGIDFASDEKATKRNARVMLRMVREINGGLLADLKTDRPEKTKVDCATCHHGQPHPRRIEEIVTGLTASKGPEAAAEEYRKLRKEHYGGFAYDFSEFPLLMLAADLMQTGKLAEALAIASLNEEFYPDSAKIHTTIGEVHRKGGDKEKAIASFKKALEMDPENRFAKMRLAEMTKPETP